KTMTSLSLKSKTLILATIVVAAMLIATPMIGYAGNGEVSQEQVEGLVALRARGIAIQKIGEEKTRMPARMGLLIKLGIRNESRIPLKVLKGRVRIGENIYNLTGGRGVVLLERHVALMRCVGVDAEGESVVFKFAVRYAHIAEDIYAIKIAGVLKAEESRVFMRLKGHAKIL
ncbi:MAG: hypothetical protein ACE5OV_04415, partial [Candidatus Bathyarchaeia archaeon]